MSTFSDKIASSEDREAGKSDLPVRRKLEGKFPIRLETVETEKRLDHSGIRVCRHGIRRYLPEKMFFGFSVILATKLKWAEAEGEFRGKFQIQISRRV